MYSALENIPIVVPLTVACNYTGWSVDGTTATHSSCESGYITLEDYPVTAGQTYNVTYVAPTLSSGILQLYAGGTSIPSHSTPGLYVESITPASNGFIQFYATGNCSVQAFYVQNITNTIGTTIAYSALNKKWSDFRTFYPDYGWSLYENTITAYQGQLYFHENGTNNTNNFYGTAYQSIIQAVFAKNPAIINTFEALSYQANQLLVSTIGGITTPLGQVTTLIDTDFIKQALNDGINSVTIYQTNNVYSASFLNDSNDDTINGQALKGNYIVVTMTTVDGSTILKLFSMAVRTARTYIGSR